MLRTTLESYLKDQISELSKEIRDEMLKQIGNPDSYLRDKLIYQSYGKVDFFRSIKLRKKSRHYLKLLYRKTTYFTGLGESGTDTVFTRSFSTLVIAAIIEYDVKKTVVNPDLVHSTVNKVTYYLMEEKDTRGFIEGKGWAHSIAHGADALGALAKHPSH